MLRFWRDNAILNWNRAEELSNCEYADFYLVWSRMNSWFYCYSKAKAL